MFSEALDKGLSAKEFVSEMRRKSKLIMGIGHRIKSLHNPDMRVTIIKTFAKEHFPRTDTLDFALEVEQFTTQKKANLILNVDGCIACAFVDLLRHCGAFTREEADEAIAVRAGWRGGELAAASVHATHSAHVVDTHTPHPPRRMAA